MTMCAFCEGTGMVDDNVECTVCNGDGRYYEEYSDPYYYDPYADYEVYDYEPSVYNGDYSEE